MMTSRLGLLILALVATGCQPTNATIQTAIAQTQQTQSTASALTRAPSPTPTAISTLAPAMTPPAPELKSQLGNIRYDLPKTGSGWCLTGSFVEADRQAQDMRSTCGGATGTRVAIELTHLDVAPTSSETAIRSEVQRMEKAGFRTDYLKFMQDWSNAEGPLGPVRIALVDVTDPAGQPVYLLYAAFEADGEHFTVRGLYDGSNEGLEYLSDSMFSLFRSVRLASAPVVCNANPSDVVDYLNLHGYGDMTEQRDQGRTSSLTYDEMKGRTYGRWFIVLFSERCVTEIRALVVNHNPPTQSELQGYSPFMSTLSSAGLTNDQAQVVISWLQASNLLEEAVRTGAAKDSVRLSPPNDYPRMELAYEVSPDSVITRYQLQYESP